MVKLIRKYGGKLERVLTESLPIQSWDPPPGGWMRQSVIVADNLSRLQLKPNNVSMLGVYHATYLQSYLQTVAMVHDCKLLIRRELVSTSDNDSYVT